MPSKAAMALRRDSELKQSADDDEIAAERLGLVDWDFNVRVVQHEVEGVHPYPAKFIADLPSAILDALPVPRGALVMDPFCGSGTTLAEAQRRGYQSIGVDLNPIACLMARVKTAPLPPDVLTSTSVVVQAMGREQHVEIPTIPNLSHWFQFDIQLALTRLMRAIESAPEAHRDFLRLAASSIIVRVSNQESDTRYAAIKKKVTSNEVREAFRKACDKLYVALSAREYQLVPAAVLEGDLLRLSLNAYDDRVGVVITSPPYPNAYEYWLYHKYRMWWLGHDPLRVKEDEIGARAHFFKKNRHTANTFVDQMNRTFGKLERLIMPRGWVCFVVGRSIIHGEIVDNAAIVEKAGNSVGFQTVFSGLRNVMSSRKSFNLSHANIKQESVLVMRKKAS